MHGLVLLLGALVAVAHGQLDGPYLAADYQEFVTWLSDGAKGVIVTDFSLCTNTPDTNPYANSIIHIDWGARVSGDSNYVFTTDFSVIDGGATVQARLDSTGELTVTSTRFSFPDAGLESELTSVCPPEGVSLFAYGVSLDYVEMQNFDDVQTALVTSQNIRVSFDWEDCQDASPELAGYSAFFYADDLRWYIRTDETERKIRASITVPARLGDQLGAQTTEIELQESGSASVITRQFATDGSINAEFTATCTIGNGLNYLVLADQPAAVVAQTFDQVQNLIFLTGKEAFVNVQVDGCEAAGDPILQGSYVVRQRASHWIWNTNSEGDLVIRGLTSNSFPIRGDGIAGEIQSLQLKDNDQAVNHLAAWTPEGGVLSEVFACPIAGNGLTVSTFQANDRPRLETPADVFFNVLHGRPVTMIVDTASCVDEDGNPGAPSTALYSVFVRSSLLSTDDTWIFYDFDIELDLENVFVAQHAVAAMTQGGDITLDLSTNRLEDWAPLTYRRLSCAFDAAIFF